MDREQAEQIKVPNNEISKDKVIVSMNNALVGAAQGLSLAEKRVMMFAVSKLDSLVKDGGTSGGVIQLSAMDYAEQFGLDPNTAYDQLKVAADHIFNRYIRFFEPERKGIKEVKVRWVSRAEYHKTLGIVTLRFTRDVQPFLAGLKAQFTTYRLAQASGFKSLYSWRLLEMFSQYKSTGWLQIELDAFLFAMEAPASYSTNFLNCRRRILEQGIKELTEKDGWVINWQPIKTGRKITALRFEFKRGQVIDADAQ